MQGGRALIITDRLIDTRRYHHTMEAVTWETSEIRRWLNGEFIARFSPSDQARIAQTYVVNNNNPWDFSDWWGGHVSTPGGRNTWDRIFLLSIDEVLQHFGDSGLVARGAAMGASARDSDATQGLSSFRIVDQFNGARIERDLQGSASSWWWLRSPGSDPYHAAIIDIDGSLTMSGGTAFREEVGYGGGVRPALWLYL